MKNKIRSLGHTLIKILLKAKENYIVRLKKEINKNLWDLFTSQEAGSMRRVLGGPGAVPHENPGDSGSANSTWQWGGEAPGEHDRIAWKWNIKSINTGSLVHNCIILCLTEKQQNTDGCPAVLQNFGHTFVKMHATLYSPPNGDVGEMCQ